MSPVWGVQLAVCLSLPLEEHAQAEVSGLLSACMCLCEWLCRSVAFFLMLALILTASAMNRFRACGYGFWVFELPVYTSRSSRLVA